MSPPVHAADLRAGDLVRIRRHRWRIVDVRSYDGCHVVTAARVGARSLGVEQRFIAPFDAVESLTRPARLRVVTSHRWRRACRALLADATPPGGLRSARQARIGLLPHQLEPALAVIRGLGSRLLLADDVGLGKTIQAGLVLSELRARGAADRALILTPAGLREQWAAELAQKFDITARVLDAREVRRDVAALPVGINPWETVDVAIASVDYVKRPEILAAIRSCRWHVLIADEAHGVANDNDRRAAVADLAARAAFVLLLTATPHSGDRRAFLSLCGLGAHGDPVLLFRHNRRDVGLIGKRRVHRLLVRPTAAERRMHALVAGFGSAVRDAWIGGAHSKRQAAPWLALAVLNKRALSSARSLERTVERRLAVLETGTHDDPLQLALPLPDPDGEACDEDRAPDLVGLALGDPRQERAMLSEILEAARLAAGRETKIAALTRYVGRISEPVVIFTEYRDTLLHLQSVLGRPVAILHGGLEREERAAVLSAFAGGRQTILLATDAAGEGLNLHHACRIVINLELPWNPMRLEQRIGRVDRIGQQRTVHVVHLIARDTAEMRVLERLRARIASARADVAGADPLDADSGTEEEEVARLVIEGSTADGADARSTNNEARGIGHLPHDSDSWSLAKRLPAPDIVPVTLNSEAVEEARRLASVRRLAARGDARATEACEIDGPWMTFARNHSTRARLGARMLFIVRSAYEDACGRPVESMLVPLLLEWRFGARPPVDRRLVGALLAAIESEVAGRAEAAAAQWRAEALALADRVRKMRLGRARAIATARAQSLGARYQPGLFDRRADRHQAELLEAASAASDEAAREIVAIERALQIHASPAQVLLVLTS